MSQKYYYYKRSQNILNRPICFNDSKLNIVKRFPSSYIPGMNRMNIGKKRLLYHMLMTLIFRGFKRTFIEYDLCKNGCVISKAVLISKVPIYDFLPPTGVHLCYCETIKEERGHGYYPNLLRYICQDNPNIDLHMVVAVDNIPSIKGIEKAGFQRYAEGIKNKDGKFIISKIL